MKYLLDANVLSELRKKRPDPKVVDWVDELDDDEVHFSVLTLGELHTGAARLAARGDEVAARSLKLWIEGLEEQYSENVIPVSRDVAETWGELNAIRPLPVIDSLLAATALAHGLTVATRNTRDFSDTGVDLHNPFSAGV